MITFLIHSNNGFPHKVSLFPTGGCPMKAALEYEKLHGVRILTVTTKGDDGIERTRKLDLWR